MISDHITSLGYRLERTVDPKIVAPLLKACALEPVTTESSAGWQPHEYLLACTRAGGIAACVGWTRGPRQVIIHSLAVAQPSRGSGIGGGLLAAVMGELMEQKPVESMWLNTDSGSARRLFSSFGFQTIEADDTPDIVREHPLFKTAGPYARTMARRYNTGHRGLDNYAFRLIQNDTPEATLPHGSVFFFRQFASVIEGSYRGGTVVRGHLLGYIHEQALKFCWHHFTDAGRLMSGDGNIIMDQLPDGRRELREVFEGSGELLLREV